MHYSENVDYVLLNKNEVFNPKPKSFDELRFDESLFILINRNGGLGSRKPRVEFQGLDVRRPDRDLTLLQGRSHLPELVALQDRIGRDQPQHDQAGRSLDGRVQVYLLRSVSA